MKTVTKLGIDGVCDQILKSGADAVTREDWIDLAWLGDPPDPWGAEHEIEVPPELQDWSWITASTSEH